MCAKCGAVILGVQDYCWAKNDTSANKIMGCSDCPVKRDSEYSDWLYPHFWLVMTRSIFCETPISLSSNVSLVNQNRTKQERQGSCFMSSSGCFSVEWALTTYCQAFKPGTDLKPSNGVPNLYPLVIQQFTMV